MVRAFEPYPAHRNGVIFVCGVSVDHPIRTDDARWLHPHGRITLVNDNPRCFQHAARDLQANHENIAASFQILSRAVFPRGAEIVDDLP